MHVLEHYEILLRARRQLLDWVRGLTAEQYRQEFPFGLKTVRATLVHLAGSEWLHGRAARGEDVKSATRLFTEARYPDFAPLVSAWSDLEAGTRAWLGSETDWSRQMETVARRRNGRVVRVRFTPETLAFQLFYHEVHHRAQVMAMLRQMGVAAEDLDFNKYAFEWLELDTK
ncbi:MAG TPA: DinB family protein [Gemmataceae bacterium]|nr:DinB family protein [Gemmataceae bacterium]